MYIKRNKQEPFISIINKDQLTDEDIIIYFYTNRYGIIKDTITPNLLHNIPTNIQQYLDNRYCDSYSNTETINRIKYSIEERPICKYCSGHVSYLKGDKFSKYCCNEHMLKDTQQERTDKINESWKNHYKEGHPSRNKEVQQKTDSTCRNKFNGYRYNREAYEQTCEERYGNKICSKTDSIKIKQKSTCNERYGTNSYLQTDELIKYNKEHHAEIEAAKYKTHKKNNSFNQSKDEDYCYEILKEHFNGVIRQYKSELYPFKCDFYIPEYDLYIEYNGSQYHHGHPFNKDTDKIELERLQKLAKTDGSINQYNKIIDIWTVKDPMKRSIAKKNNLNYIELWSKKDLEKLLILYKK